MHIYATDDFARFAKAEAQREGISVSQLIERRVRQAPSDDDALLVELTRELQEAVPQAREEVRHALAITTALMQEIKQQRESRSKAAA